MKRLLIVGAGISGLTAARTAADEATRKNLDLDIVVLEKETTAGGKARTHRDGEWLVEEGPTGYLDNEPTVDQVVDRVGLEAQRFAADSAAARRFLYVRGKMREIFPHPLRLARSGILRPWEFLRLAFEPFIAGKKSDDDESVWNFARRRLGRGAADSLIAPMVLGVFAGDAKRLSLPAAFPKLVQLEREHGSLIRGMIAKRKAGKTKGGPAGPGGVLTSLRGGLQELPRALCDTKDFDVRLGVTVASISRNGAGRYVLQLDDGSSIQGDAILFACEAWASAGLMDSLNPNAARELNKIPYPAVTVVAFGYPPGTHSSVPQGFGVLVPRGEGIRSLGCLWDSHIFTGRSPDGHLLLRCMIGGATDEGAMDLDPDRLKEIVRQDLQRLFGLDANPVFEHVKAWRRAIPQYELGHLDRVARIEQAFGETPGLFLAGNALHGIAFGKAAAEGKRQGLRVVEWMMRSGEP